MTDTMLAEVLRDRLPRLYAAGADANDVGTLMSRIEAIGDWPVEWERLANERLEMGEAALLRSRALSAGAAFQAASLYFHFAQFVFFDDLGEKRRLQRRQADAFARAAPLLHPPATPIAVPFDGVALRAHLRVPEGLAGPRPCVLLNPGADSTKEEFHTLENEFLARGLATLSYDGPGQGLTSADRKLRPDYEAPIGAVLDCLDQFDAIDIGRIGLWGRSFGAYCVLRGATDPRVRACVAIGGFYDLSAAWARMPKGTIDAFRYGFGGVSGEEGAVEARRYRLVDTLAKVGCPVLVVHSGQDNVCPVEDSVRIIDGLPPDAELQLFEEGNHVCDNIPYKVRPLMADWLAERLIGDGGDRAVSWAG